MTLKIVEIDSYMNNINYPDRDEALESYATVRQDYGHSVTFKILDR